MIHLSNLDNKYIRLVSVSSLNNSINMYIAIMYIYQASLSNLLLSMREYPLDCFEKLVKANVLPFAKKTVAAVC